MERWDETRFDVHEEWKKVPEQAIFVISDGDSILSVWMTKNVAEFNFASNRYIDVFPFLGGNKSIHQFFIDSYGIMAVDF